MTETDRRCWLYHAEHEPKIFETEAELEAAAAEGWVDHPVDFAPVPEAAQAADVPPRLTDELIEQSTREGPFAAPAAEVPKAKKRKRAHLPE